MVKNNTTVFWLLIMAAIAAAVQLTGFVNLDDAWLIDVTKRVLNGERLNIDVIETNPPLIIYITSIPLIAAKFLHLGPISSFIIFTTLLGIFSCLIAFKQLNNKLTALSISFAIFILPNLAYGEREHYLLILILPYFISQISANKPSTGYQIISGLMAGIGFSIKPFFAIIWLAIIICKYITDRKIFTVENFLIGITGLSYLVYLYFVEQTYINTILPQLLKYYFAFGTNWKEAFKQSIGFIFAFQISTLVLYIKNRPLLNRQIYFSSALCILTVILALIQNKTWLNYFYPPLFFSFLSNSLIIFVVKKDTKPLWHKVILILSAITIITPIVFSLINNFKMVHGKDYDEANKLVKIFNQNATNNSVYPISFDLGAIYPAVIYSNAQNYSRYGHLWMLPGIYAGEKVQNGEMIYHTPLTQNANEAKIFQDVINQLIKIKPAIITVSKPDYTYLNAGQVYRFDFIKYFSNDPKFKAFWQNYKKTDQVDYQEIYLRKPEPSAREAAFYGGRPSVRNGK